MENAESGAGRAESLEEEKSPTDRYYVISGKYSLFGLCFMLAGGAFASPFLGTIYAVLSYYIPLYIPVAGAVNVLLIYGVGVGISWVIVYLAKIMKVRNPVAAGIIGGICAFICLYFAWAMYLCFAVNNGKIELVIFFPNVLWRIIVAVNKTGLWSVNNLTPSGIILWVLWGFELICFLWGTFDVCRKRMSETTFCETCECWTVDQPDLAKLELVDQPDMLVKALEEEHYEIFEMLPSASSNLLRRVKASDRKKAEKIIKKAEKTAKKTGDESELERIREENALPGIRRYLKVSAAQCPQCQEESFLSIAGVTLAPNNAGVDMETSGQLVNRLRVPRKLLADLRERHKALGER